MKKILSTLILLFLCTNYFSQEAAKETSPKTVGKVSHQFKKTGCSTVIIIKNTAPMEDVILIPKTALPKKWDKDGLEISFLYKPLRMPNPKGCEKGIPAELSNIQSLPHHQAEK